MNSQKSVSVIIPAYNEQENIERAILAAKTAVTKYLTDYEIIVIDDGSKDDTFDNTQKLATRDHKIKIFRHFPNRGFGGALIEGIKHARGTYVTVFPSDNEMSPISLSRLIKERTKADLVVSYIDRPSLRTPLRRLLSWTFTQAMNAIFGLNLRYFNGPLICRQSILHSIPIQSQGYSVFAEIIVRLLKRGVSYREIPFVFVPRVYGKSKAVTFKSFYRALLTIRMLLDDKGTVAVQKVTTTYP